MCSRRRSLTNTGRGISTRPLTQDNQATQTWGQTGAVCVRRAWEQTDIVQLIRFLCVCWLKTEKACMRVYVPTIHPWKQTVTDRMALFIKSSRHVTCSRQPKATKRPSRLSLQPRPPCLTSDWKYFKSSKQKSKVSFTADLTNRIKSWTGGLHFTEPLFYDFLFGHC